MKLSDVINTPGKFYSCNYIEANNKEILFITCHSQAVFMTGDFIGGFCVNHDIEVTELSDVTLTCVEKFVFKY